MREGLSCIERNVKVFDRWRVVSIYYYDSKDKANGKELGRYMSPWPHMTYRGAVREIARRTWQDTIENRYDRKEYVIVRSSDNWE